MKSIHTLIPDVQELLKTKGWFTNELSEEFSNEVSMRLAEQFNRPDKTPTLRLSQMGPRCPRALWYSIHEPERAEVLPPWAEFKYTFGHTIEGLAIALAKAAGHTVTGEQDAVTVDGVVGHRDCIIDGCLVDVKSAASFSYLKFKDKSIKDNDSFGYLDQLDGYLVGGLMDPLVKVKDIGYLWAIDKQLGHMCLYEHRIREQHIRERVKTYKEIVGRSRSPECTCETVPDGKSGNQKLGTKASYSAFKHVCFPGLRTFLYASGPVYLTKVVRVPDVLEVDKLGKPLYN